MVLCAHIVKMILNTKQKKILLLSGSTFAGKHHDGSARMLVHCSTKLQSQHQHVTFPELWTNYIWY